VVNIHSYMKQHYSFGKKSCISSGRKRNQISVEQTYVVELNQITTQKTNENAHSLKSHRIDKRRDSIAEAFKRFISSSNNGLVSVVGTTLVSGQFGPTDQTEIHTDLLMV
ncbi:702_t:CDS:1, partial [Gigaspora rosea]